MAHICNLITQVVESEYQVQGHPRLYSESYASLGYLILCLYFKKKILKSPKIRAVGLWKTSFLEVSSLHTAAQETQEHGKVCLGLLTSLKSPAHF